MQQEQDMKTQQVAITSLTQLGQHERLLASRESDNKRRRHSGNNSGFGKVALADIAESNRLCQSFVGSPALSVKAHPVAFVSRRIALLVCHAAWHTRCAKRSNFARPYIWRLISCVV